MMSPDSSNAAQGSRPGPSIEFSPIASKQVYHEGTAASTSNANTHRGLFASPDSARTALTTTSKKRAHTHRNLRELLATRRAIHNEPVSLTNDPKKLARVCSELDMNDFDEDKVYERERSQREREREQGAAASSSGRGGLGGGATRSARSLVRPPATT
jgi:hypothetical protein